MIRHRTLAAAGAALLSAATAAILPPSPAAAAPLGTISLTQTSGTVDATPIFRVATTARPCPAGYGADAQLRVGRPGGPYSNLARPMTAGGYDKAPVTGQPNRSFAAALGGAPADGEWWVVVECLSQTEGVHPDRFVTEITVSGRQWRTGRPAGAAPPVDPASPPDPATATAGDPTGTPGATALGAAPTASAGTRLTGGLRLGSASLANVWWMLGLVGVLAVVGVVHLAAGRRRGRRGRPAGRRQG
ncbi:hypothetical protein [Rhizomonospora bruguierae]|uniref:hypothetical protein n=1 Tax=Rhizomonospora bruguierae TaxID=1581705 RepID=UPI001BCF871C|nr:hypothetical protein [Micromonospora sp. NBRC 107566]